MRIDVIGRNLEITDAIRQYGESKANKLTKYYAGLQQVTLTIARENAQTVSDFNVEMVLDVEKHKDFVSHASASDPYAAIDLVCEKGERQLRDFKERLQG